MIDAEKNEHADKVIGEFIVEIEKIRDDLIGLLGKLVETYSAVQVNIDDCSPGVRIRLECTMQSLQGISSAALIAKEKSSD